jgi:hypothetical protein
MILPGDPPYEAKRILDPVLNPVSLAGILVRSQAIRKSEGLA